MRPLALSPLLLVVVSGCPASSPPTEAEHPHSTPAANALGAFARAYAAGDLAAIARVDGGDGGPCALPPGEPGSAAVVEAATGDVAWVTRHMTPLGAQARNEGELGGPKKAVFPFKRLTSAEAVALHMRHDGYLGFLVVVDELAAEALPKVPAGCLSAIGRRYAELLRTKPGAVAADLASDLKYEGRELWRPEHAEYWPPARDRLETYLSRLAKATLPCAGADGGANPTLDGAEKTIRELRFDGTSVLREGKATTLGCAVFAVRTLVSARVRQQAEDPHGKH